MAQVQGMLPTKTFDDEAQEIEELVRDKDAFWCGHCHKTLFFVPNYPDHYG
jgi:hypothetical protein